MRDKHIHIKEDSELLKNIYREIDDKLVFNKRKYNTLIWIKLFLYLSLSVFFYLALYFDISPLLFILCFMAYGLSTLLLAFNFSHDLSHNTVFKSKGLNHFGFTLIYSIVGAHAEEWKQRHIHSHHYAPNVEEYDSDLQITSLIRVTPGSKLKWFHRYQHLYAPLAYTTYSLFWVFIKDFVILFSKNQFNTRRNTTYYLSFFVQKCGYLILLLVAPVLFSSQSILVVFCGFVAMHLFQSLFLLFTFFMTHHVESTEYPDTDENGFIKTSWLMNQVKSSNDMHPFSETANFILGGFNNHIAHHLFPHVHHIYYPELNRLLYAILRKNHIEPNQTTYWGGIVSHLRLLKKMGNDTSIVNSHRVLSTQ